MIVDKFMCLYLETAGLINSWFLLCLFTVAEMIIGYSFWWNVLECKAGNKSHKESVCYEINSIVILVSIAIVLYAWIIMCWLSIKGIKRRSFELIKPLMIWEGISSGCSAIFIGSEPIYGFTLLILNIYLFIILFSLYVKFKEENEPPQTSQLPESSA